MLDRDLLRRQPDPRVSSQTPTPIGTKSNGETPPPTAEEFLKQIAGFVKTAVLPLETAANQDNPSARINAGGPVTTGLFERLAGLAAGKMTPVPSTARIERNSVSITFRPLDSPNLELVSRQQLARCAAARTLPPHLEQVKVIVTIAPEGSTTALIAESLKPQEDTPTASLYARTYCAPVIVTFMTVDVVKIAGRQWAGQTTSLAPQPIYGAPLCLYFHTDNQDRTQVPMLASWRPSTGQRRGRIDPFAQPPVMIPQNCLAGFVKAISGLNTLLK